MSERTPEEREFARLERERRRAEREPLSPAEQLAATGAQLDEPEREPDDQPTGEHELFEAPTGEHEPLEQPAGEHEPLEQPAGEHEPLERPAVEHGRVDGATDGHEIPLGTRRATAGERPRAPARSHGRARAGIRPPRSRAHSWVARALAVVALALAVAALWFLDELFQPFHGKGHGSVTVTIEQHEGATQVGDQLARDGVISSGFFFNLRALLAGDRGKLLAGTYHLALGMPYGDVLRILTTPPAAAKVTNVTLIEGLTRRQIDALLRSQGIHGSYLADTRSSPLLDPRRYGASAGIPSLEGFLFPSTYQLRVPISIPALVADQLETFRQVFAGVNLRYAQSRHLTPYDVLIIASMVQAEAATAHDAPLVASVIYNRLAAGMPLQIDATTRYATGNYTKPLTESELNSPSPYNTRNHRGLPPTPIDNPGLAAMQAAAHPANTAYLYFVVKVCGNGEMTFTASYAQFESLVAQYQEARARNGGRSPANC